MTLDLSNIVVRFLFAVLVWFLFSAGIDMFVKDARFNEIFKFVLFIICLLIVFAVQLVIR